MRRFASSQGVHKQRSAFTPAHTMCCSRGLESLFFNSDCVYLCICVVRVRVNVCEDVLV